MVIDGGTLTGAGKEKPDEDCPCLVAGRTLGAMAEGADDMTRSIRDWFELVVGLWRRRWPQATPGVRRRFLASWVPVDQPLQLHAYALRGPAAPLLASAFVLRRDAGRPDLEVELSTIELGQPWPEHCPIPVRDFLDMLIGNMMANWHPSRPPDPPREPWHLAGWILDGEPPSCFRAGPGRVWEVEPEHLVAHDFREEPPTVLPAPAASPVAEVVHIADAGQNREALAIRRWLDQARTWSLLRTFGMFAGRTPPFGWWCGLNLPRAEVFNDKADGDVDLVAGLLDFDLTEDEWRDRIWAEADSISLAAHPSWALNLAALRAAEEGKIKWPPRFDFLVACEVKASTWETKGKARWKTTHLGESRRVIGQLQYLLDHGVDRVALLHLGATTPREQPAGNPWFVAGRDAVEAEDALDLIFDPKDLPSCGYCASVLGAVHHTPEDFAGAGGNPIEVTPPRPNPTAAGSGPWRASLGQRLGRLPRPPWPTAFILPCPQCRAWVLAPATWSAWCNACGWRT